jgi:molybdate transport system substrate-binding protein
MKLLLLLFIIFNSLLFAKEEFIFYCGITMVKPMLKISKIIEKKYHIKVRIIQGGSGDLYDSLSISKKGDLYLPGSDSYLKKHEKEGIFGYRKYVGYNQIAIFVKKGNPKKIKTLKDFLRKDVKVAIGNPESGSIGKAGEKVLKKFGGEKFLEKIEDLVVMYATDSRDLNNLLKKGEVDVGLSWKATAFFPENREFLSIIEIPEKYSPKKKLVLTQLKFSKYPEIAKYFIDYASGKEGKKIMKEYGFLNE